MKIRIKDNSVRFRLSKREVQTLCTNGSISARTEFNDAVFSYCIQVSEVHQQLAAVFNGQTITLFFPKQDADTWYTNDIITHKNIMTLQNGNTLSMLLEKDFVCLDHTDEDQSDNYPNPNKTC
ncbi:MAG: hypothetical protein RL660_3038 [Bacteroidota bacterium]|jgi:hypothetical protein